MTNQHPDAPPADDEVNDVTRRRQEDLGHPHLDEELDRSDLDEVSDASRPGQNSDWLPQ